MRFVLGLIACLLLPSCIDGDVTLDFVSADQVVTRSSFYFPQPVVDAIGAPPAVLCGSGEARPEAGGLTCSGAAEASVAMLTTGEIDLGSVGAKTDLSRYVTVEQLSPEKLRVTIDFATLLRAIREGDLHEIGAVGITPASSRGFEGVIFRIRAPEIVATTGRLSEDGSEARFVLPAAGFFDSELNMGGPFITVINLKKSCLLSLFCD